MGTLGTLLMHVLGLTAVLVHGPRGFHDIVTTNQSEMEEAFCNTVKYY